MRILIILFSLFTISEEEPKVSTTQVSYYAEPFHGRLTANGETYDMNVMTAASPTLPFNTYVKVTNVANGKQVTVRINDRGPFKCEKGTAKAVRPLEPHPQRGFDLSKAAFKEISPLSKGVLNVKYKILN